MGVPFPVRPATAATALFQVHWPRVIDVRPSTRLGPIRHPNTKSSKGSPPDSGRSVASIPVDIHFEVFKIPLHVAFYLFGIWEGKVVATSMCCFVLEHDLSGVEAFDSRIFKDFNRCFPFFRFSRVASAGMQFPVFSQQFSGSFVKVFSEICPQNVFFPSGFMAGAISLFMQDGWYLCGIAASSASISFPTGAKKLHSHLMWSWVEMSWLQ